MIDIAQKYIVVMKNRAKYTENHMEQQQLCQFDMKSVILYKKQSASNPLLSQKLSNFLLNNEKYTCLAYFALILH